MLRLKISLPTAARRSDIHIGSAVRLDCGQLIQKSLSNLPRSVCLISNERVFKLFGKGISRALGAQGFRIEHWMMGEGERFKSLKTLGLAVNFLAEKRLERDDAVIAVGGGVVGDLAGLAASIYLRGISFVQLPTTLLAQIDSSVGGKTGVNLTVGKNLVGTFYQPSLVIIDTETLLTLPRRELVAGFCEMVKQALVSDASLFESTLSFLESKRRARNDLDNSVFQSLIRDHCQFKTSIVMNDERESTTRSDETSRRILNFGHTTAHAIEAITNYRRFRHGEAVGYGMLVAGEISNYLGLLERADLKAIRHLVSLCGPLPRAYDLDKRQIMRALSHDKKRVGGQVNWVLLNGIGNPRIVNGKEISDRLIREALEVGLSHAERRTGH